MDSTRIPPLVTDQVRPHAREILAKVKKFVEHECIPADEVFDAQMSWDPEQRSKIPTILEDLKKKARGLGLWNLWLHSHYEGGAGFTNVEYGLMCETMGRSRIASETMNCSAPDTGNMEVLAKYGTEEQKKEWLQPLLEGEIRSAFVMTERRVASSNAKNISLEMRRDGNSYVLNGSKWWISSAGDPRCKLYIVFVKSNPESSNPNKQHSVVLVRRDTPGIKVLRRLHVFGYDDEPHGHCEVEFRNVRIPASNIILGEGLGFEVMQGRMGPGRIHHCMRAIGCAERGLEYMIARANDRQLGGKPLSDQGVIADWIARSRIDIDCGRMLVLNAAAKIDRFDAKVAMAEIAMAKIYVPTMALGVLDRAIQVHGAGGICQDFPLSRIWAYLRTTRIADGPDEAHVAQLARLENKTSAELISKIETQEAAVERLKLEYNVKNGTDVAKEAQAVLSLIT